MALVHLVIGVDLTWKLRINRVTDDSSADNNCKPLDFENIIHSVKEFQVSEPTCDCQCQHESCCMTQRLTCQKISKLRFIFTWSPSSKLRDYKPMVFLKNINGNILKYLDCGSLLKRTNGRVEILAE